MKKAICIICKLLIQIKQKADNNMSAFFVLYSHFKITIIINSVYKYITTIVCFVVYYADLSGIQLC